LRRKYTRYAGAGARDGVGCVCVGVVSVRG
jgi:hypothetical protein